jgi:phosphatidylinositol alpha-1,6-mannosyltransferase
MKYLLYTLEYPPFKGGVANYYENLVKFWPGKNIKVLNNNDEQLINNRLLILKWLPAFFVLRKKIQENKIGYILVGHILPLGTTTWLLSKISSCKYSIILHGLDFTSAIKKPRKKILTSLILSSAETIICGNNYLADLVKQKFPKISKKIKVVNPAAAEIEPDNFLVKKIKEKYQLENKFVLFSLGRLVKRKGIDKTIEALAKIKKDLPNIKYFIAGAGPDEKYLKEILSQNTDLAKDIMFLGQISEIEKWTWFTICDAFILPSREINNDFEGFGIVYLEANLAGKPVIAGDSGGVRDAVQNNLNGLLVNSKDSNAIADAILKIYKNSDLSKKLGEQGRERVKKEFNWQNQIKKLYNYLNQ